MKNRQKEEILRDVLSVCRNNSTITEVMFHACMTHGQAKGYLQDLITNSLVEYDPLHRRYHATSKGMEYLRAIDVMAELFPIPTKQTAREHA